jgi:hypothetical protein
MSKAKVWFAYGLMVLALVAAVYVSGHLSLLLLKLSDVPLTWNTYWLYVHALDLPQVASYAGKIKVADAIGFGLLLSAILTILILKPRIAAPHGVACFANRADLAEARLLKKIPEGTLGILLLTMKSSSTGATFSDCCHCQGSSAMNPTVEAQGATMQQTGGMVVRVSVAVPFATYAMAELT